MFCLEELLSNKNQKEALRYIETKKDSLGSDGLLLSELKEFWSLNSSAILSQIKNGSYVPTIVKQCQLLKTSGGYRTISLFGNLDRFLLRMLAQKLERYMNPLFLANSFAFQAEKGVLAAIQQAKNYLIQGNSIVIEIDLYHYFDTIPLDRLNQQLEAYFSDQRVREFIQAYLFCSIESEGRVFTQFKGLIQGSAISPILSNLYLHPVDCYLESRGFNWLRYADNLYIYVASKEEALPIYQEIRQLLVDEFQLVINEKKSGIFSAFNRRVLGYEFYLKNNIVECQKHHYTRFIYSSRWHPSQLQFANRQYYIIENGILNKKDYSLLFENEEHKHHLPIEVVEQINIYSEVVISPQTLHLLYDKKIPLVLHNQFGDIQSYFIPESMRSSAPILLAQSQLYLSEEKRVTVAKQFELAHLHNMRANCRYYLKKFRSNGILRNLEQELTNGMNAVRTTKSVDDLMLLEARAKQQYYQLYNEVLNQEQFCFTKRTKRPPRDALNALISFCNTVLYSQVLRLIWKSRLDPKIAVLHASNNRPYSLHLDFADYFKPIIVDRVILSLINRHQIHMPQHFEYKEDGAVWLNSAGKRIVLEALESKFHTRLVLKHTTYTYHQLIQRDVQLFKKFILGDRDVKRFTPFKYY
ncbi:MULTISPECIES: CRISPR-associated endonuclease Cas1 [Streptococcus]|nr:MULTISPECIES: CRISPR-associated endonuclease Cas1 [unclassified Streptococcus]QTH48647.1 CRISPR-associated endonuclease Cas1 [Streptococcus sp. zg-86]